MATILRISEPWYCPVLCISPRTSFVFHCRHCFSMFFFSNPILSSHFQFILSQVDLNLAKIKNVISAAKSRAELEAKVAQLLKINRFYSDPELSDDYTYEQLLRNSVDYFQNTSEVIQPRPDLKLRVRIRLMPFAFIYDCSPLFIITLIPHRYQHWIREC